MQSVVDGVWLCWCAISFSCVLWRKVWKTWSKFVVHFHNWRMKCRLTRSWPTCRKTEQEMKLCGTYVCMLIVNYNTPPALCLRGLWARGYWLSVISIDESTLLFDSGSWLSCPFLLIVAASAYFRVFLLAWLLTLQIFTEASHFWGPYYDCTIRQWKIPIFPFFCIKIVGEVIRFVRLC